ncbi:DNA-invertase hin [Rubripirellula lacrimiformis]|uniref:DNA-invertase hin n=1 Tax=Rubripirellula lacrimiformis TaxID=1930273 RepID=A0A517NAU8_9BACT|nr:recombinase family protein [Rubripirellula lacrimiformis]QDT04250.1 DNA-invertase hin [Rubripirellula lacrimiformis]
MRHIAIYVRVSTKAQDTASQEADLKKWVQAHVGDEPVQWYRDKFTGKVMDRPGWSKLEAAMQAGRVSKLICWRLDRLGRTAKGLTALFDDLPKWKVRLVSIKDGLDLGTAAGRLMANVLASVAQFETEVRAERVLAGQARAKADGKTWGGSEKGRLLSVTQDQVEMILRLHGEGKSKSAIARATSVSRPTVYRIIDQRA